MIVDACLYAGEVDMLELRLRTLADVVDLFVVVTCKLTHQGEPAGPFDVPDVSVPIFHRVIRPRTHLPVGERGGVGSRYYQTIEREHRNGVRDACVEAGVPGDAMVMVSDVDEIPEPRSVTQTAQWLPGLSKHQMCWLTFEQRFHSTALDLLHPQQPWYGTCAARMTYLYPQDMRDARGTVGTDEPTILPVNHGGWHLSWFGTDAERQRKLDTFSHAELRGWDVAGARARREHANGEPLRQLNHEDMTRLDWPAPLTDGTFTIPPSWLS